MSARSSVATPWLNGFSDHKLSLDLPFDSPHATVYALCFVRDPVERFISRFFFHRNFEEVNCIAQSMTFREFANAELLEKHAHPQTNSQICFLNGGGDHQNLDVIDRAIATDRAFLFPIERFDEACIVLEKRFPQTFTDLSYVAINTSNRQDKIDGDDRALVSNLLAADFQLNSLANSQMQRWLETTFDSASAQADALAEFRDRCSRRYPQFPPIARQR